jgi:excisionase family DNA binding protein
VAAADVSDPLAFLSAEARAAFEAMVAAEVERQLDASARARGDSSPAWLPLTEAAEHAGFATKTLRRAIDAGELRASKVRGRWRVAVADLEAWLDRGHLSAGAPAVHARAGRARPRTAGGFRELASRREGGRRR